MAQGKKSVMCALKYLTRHRDGVWFGFVWFALLSRLSSRLGCSLFWFLGVAGLILPSPCITPPTTIQETPQSSCQHKHKTTARHSGAPSCEAPAAPNETMIKSMTKRNHDTVTQKKQPRYTAKSQPGVWSVLRVTQSNHANFENTWI